MQKTRSPNWEYVGYVFAAVGFALALTGTIAFYSLQQGSIPNRQYSAYFLPILLAGIVNAVLGGAAFVKAGQERKKEVPPPPPPPPPPP